MAFSTKKNFAYQTAWQILLIAAPLLTTPYLSRVLGPDGVGMYSYSYSTASYFAMFAILGMSTHGVRAIAACGDDRAERSKTFWSAFAAQASVGSLAFIAYPLFVILLVDSQQIVWAVWCLDVLASVVNVSWLFFGVQEFKLPTMRSIAIKVATVASIFIFVRTEADLWIYCLILAVGALANQALLWAFVGRYVDFCRPERPEVVRHLKSSAALFIPLIATSLYTLMDKVLLGTLAGTEQTGFYEYSQKLSTMPLALITALGTVMLPRMSEELGKGNRGKALALLDKSIWVMLVAAFALAFGISAIAYEFAPVFLGDDYASCWSTMIVLTLTIPAITVTNVLGRQYLIPSARDGYYSASVWFAAVVNLVINVLLIPSMAANGAAVATVCAEYAALLLQAALVRKDLPLLSYFKNSIPFFCMGATMLLVVRLVAAQLDMAWGFTAVGLAIEIVVGAVAYSLLFLIWGFTTRNSHFIWLMNSLLKRNISARV